MFFFFLLFKLFKSKLTNTYIRILNIIIKYNNLKLSKVFNTKKNTTTENPSGSNAKTTTVKETEGEETTESFDEEQVEEVEAMSNKIKAAQTTSSKDGKSYTILWIACCILFGIILALLIDNIKGKNEKEN